MSKNFLRIVFVLLVAVGCVAINPRGTLLQRINLPRGHWYAIEAKADAQTMSACDVGSTPTTPNPVLPATEYTAGPNTEFTVNGHTVKMYVYTPHSLAGTNHVLIFVAGGGFGELKGMALNQARGIGGAFKDDTGNVLTIMPINEFYTYPPHVTGQTTPAPPTSGTPAAYEQALDTGCAIAWAKQYSYLYGGSTTPHITLVGYSAGAGVVASVMVAADKFIPNPTATLSDVHGVMTMSGNYDYKKAEDAADPFYIWYYKRGDPNGALETSPLQLGSPNPKSTFTLPWITEYEQCDADEHYASAEHFTSNLVNGWNGGHSFTYENTQHYTYAGYPGSEPVPQSTHFVAIHGDGQYALALSGSNLYNLLRSLIVGTLVTPGATPFWETVPTPGSVTAVQDVAAGTDGSIWALSTSPPAGSTTGFAIAKYGNPGNNNECITPLQAPAESEPASAIAVDGYGDPWIIDANSGSVETLPGGYIAAAPTPEWTSSGPVWLPTGGPGQNGLAATFSPAGSADATEIGAGGGSLSGSVAPPVYLSYSRNIGSVWITTTTPSPTSPLDYTLQYFNGTGYTTKTGYGTQITADQSGNAWVVTNSGSIYTTGAIGTCASAFCLVASPGGSRNGVFIGSGAANMWVTTKPAPNSLWYLQLGSTTWTELSGFSAIGPITGTVFGLPVVRKSDNSLNIYHTCTWPDGSAADGSSPCVFP